MRLCLYDDPVARGWLPLALTRPVGELLFGAQLLRERLERATGLECAGYIAVPGLTGFVEPGAPGLIELEKLAREPAVFLSSRYVPPTERVGGLLAGAELRQQAGGEPVRLAAAGTHVGWVLPDGAELSADSIVLRSWDPGSASSVGPPGDLDSHPVVELPGTTLATPWELVARNAEQLQADLGGASASVSEEGAASLPKLPGVERIGDGVVSAAGEVVVDPGVALDTRDGPIHFAAGVSVRPFSYVRGPAFVGAGSILLGGTFESVSIGPVCKLRGEVSESIVLGYANKAHDGYLGHSLVGRWVNLGAYTTNSDLKNNYGSIRVGRRDGEVDTEMLKMGVFLGDHVKTGIGTRLNAGTCVGAGTNLIGGEPPPKWVPPFRWGDGRDLAVYRLEAFLETARRTMERRGIALPPEQRAFLTRIWTQCQPSSAEEESP